MNNLSNCHLVAWKKFRDQDADLLCIEYTKKSKLHYFTKNNKYIRSLLLPIRIIGILIQWICWPMVHVGEFLRTGRWYHVSWMEDGIHREYVKLDNYVARLIPPIIFKGTEQVKEKGN